MKVKMREVRTVLEGSLSNGGGLTLDYSCRDGERPDAISFNAQAEDMIVNGSYYIISNSINISINGVSGAVGGIIDEIYTKCESVVNGDVVE